MPIERLAGITGNVANKAPVRVASTQPLVLQGLQTIDGIAVAEGDRILVKNQASSIENGIYIAGAGSWYRAYDFNGPRDVVRGTLIFVNDGTTNGDTVWRIISPTDPVTPGVSSITFDQIQIVDTQPPDFSDIYAIYDEIVAMYNQIHIWRDEVYALSTLMLNELSGVPVGIIAWYTTTVAPTGWLECNGAAISRALYPDLFRMVGITYGAGDGVNTFNIPDLRGLHIRGWDNGRGVDPGRAFYSYQAAQVGPHTHAAYTSVTGTTDTQGSHTHTSSGLTNGVTTEQIDGILVDSSYSSQGGWTTSPAVQRSGSGTVSTLAALFGGGANNWSFGVAASGAHAHNISVTATTTIYNNGTSENRVQNVSLLPCIKATGPASLPRVGWAAQTLDPLTQIANAIGTIGRASNTFDTITQVARATKT
jgi:microcystin-dependent protein